MEEIEALPYISLSRNEYGFVVGPLTGVSFL
jgi:hypothetical protein